MKIERLIAISFVELIFVVGSITLFIGFFMFEASKLYPLVIFLTIVLSVSIFRERIYHLELSGKGLIIKMKEAEDKNYQKLESLKNEWGYFEGGEKNGLR